ncbi:unnamed protein product [Chrysoparadoxa australica]
MPAVLKVTWGGVVSCNDLGGVQELRDAIVAAVQGSSRFPAVGYRLSPQEECLQRSLKRMKEEGKYHTTRDELWGMWMSCMGDLKVVVPGNHAKVMTDLLLKNHQAGTLFDACGFIHLEPLRLLNLVEPLSSARLEECSKTEEWMKGIKRVEQGDIGGSFTAHNMDIQEDEQLFIHGGILSSQYLRCLWYLWEGGGQAMASGLEGDAFFAAMEQTMVYQGIIIPIQGQARYMESNAAAGEAHLAVGNGWFWGGLARIYFTLTGYSNVVQQSMFVVPSRFHANRVTAVMKRFLQAKKSFIYRGVFTFAPAVPRTTLFDYVAACLRRKTEVMPVEVMTCSKQAVHISVDSVEVLVTAGWQCMAIYTTSSNDRDCKQVLGHMVNWFKELVRDSFSGLMVTPPVAREWRSINSSNHHLAQELGLLGHNQPYDVFLSHAGPQKWGIVDLLHKLLWCNGVVAFMDRENLEPSGNAGDDMLRAAWTAAVAVVVLSPEFLCRRWCLIELSIFMRRLGGEGGIPVKVVPLFYRLTPNECSNPLNMVENYTSVKQQWVEWSTAIPMEESREGDSNSMPRQLLRWLSGSWWQQRKPSAREEEAWLGDGKAAWPGKWQELLPNLVRVAEVTGLERSMHQYDLAFAEAAKDAVMRCLA